MNRRHWREN